MKRPTKLQENNENIYYDIICMERSSTSICRANELSRSLRRWPSSRASQCLHARTCEGVICGKRYFISRTMSGEVATRHQNYFEISAFPSSLCLRHTATRQGLDRNTEIRNLAIMPRMARCDLTLPVRSSTDYSSTSNRDLIRHCLHGRA